MSFIFSKPTPRRALYAMLTDFFTAVGLLTPRVPRRLAGRAAVVGGSVLAWEVGFPPTLTHITWKTNRGKALWMRGQRGEDMWPVGALGRRYLQPQVHRNLPPRGLT